MYAYRPEKEPMNQIQITNKTLAAQVQERIREAILNRDLTPGDRIDQAKLAESLNVSIVPVREALKGLESEGLVSIIPRRGAFVTEISQEHLDDLYDARQIIEGEVIFHAVQHLVDADFATLHELIQQMETATRANDIRLFMSLNRQFHMGIYQALGNRHLIQTIESLWERSELYRYRYMFVMHNADLVHQEHRAIVRACEERNPPKAKELAIQHIRNTQLGLHRELDTELGK